MASAAARFKLGKAPGSDGIPTWILKSYPSKIAPILKVNLLNQEYYQLIGSLPSYIIPIYNKRTGASSSQLTIDLYH